MTEWSEVINSTTSWNNAETFTGEDIAFDEDITFDANVPFDGWGVVDTYWNTQTEVTTTWTLVA
jgi:hypothetical protein